MRLTIVRLVAFAVCWIVIAVGPVATQGDKGTFHFYGAVDCPPKKNALVKVRDGAIFGRPGVLV